MLKLYDYWRSSASYRLRIALEMKGVAFESITIDLHPNVREHQRDAYRRLNPQMRVPAIEVDGQVIGQSMAIMEWIDETWPEPSLFPADSVARLKARAFANTIASDVHPLNNPSVLKILKDDFGADKAAIANWYGGWITRGFAALEAQTPALETPFLFGDAPTIAEICLVPQVYNARRFEVDLSAFPRLVAVDAACQMHAAFQAASPEAVKPT
ncbi:MAG: maleylacetoacetate isomerase [Henriciella sp.]|nr:maleylacetoacetate isomerase [Henriciella sp.]